MAIQTNEEPPTLNRMSISVNNLNFTSHSKKSSNILNLRTNKWTTRQRKFKKYNDFYTFEKLAPYFWISLAVKWNISIYGMSSVWLTEILEMFPQAFWIEKSRIKEISGNQSVHPSVCQPANLSVCLSVRLSVCLQSVSQTVYQSVKS